MGVHVFELREGAVPVVAVATLDGYLVLPGYLSSSEDGAFPVFGRKTSVVVAAVDVDVGEHELVTRVVLGIGSTRFGDRGNHPLVVRRVHHTTAGVYTDREVLNLLVVAQHEVAVEVARFGVVEDEAAAVDHFGITPSRGILARFVVALVVVVFDTSLQVEVGDNLPVGRDAAEGTVDYLFAGHAVEQPPGVVQVDGVGKPYLFAVIRVGECNGSTIFYYRYGHSIATYLRYNIAVWVGFPSRVGVVVVLAIPIHVEVTRRGVKLIDGVEKGTTGGAVFGLLVDVVGRDVNLEFVLEEGEALTQGDVVTLELVGLDDTVGRRISVREIGLGHFRTTAQRDGVVEVGTRAVEVADIV